MSQDEKPAKTVVSKRKLKILSVGDKIDILEAIECSAPKSHAEFAKQFDIPAPTMSRILKEKDKIVEVAMRGYSKRKRLRPAKYPELESQLMDWLKIGEGIEVPVTGHAIQRQAMQIAAALKITDFVASNGWLEGFKKRCGALRNLTVTRDCKDEWTTVPSLWDDPGSSGGDPVSADDDSPTRKMRRDPPKDKKAELVSKDEAKSAILTLKKYFRSSEGTPETIFDMLETIDKCSDYVGPASP